MRISITIHFSYIVVSEIHEVYIKVIHYLGVGVESTPFANTSMIRENKIMRHSSLTPRSTDIENPTLQNSPRYIKNKRFFVCNNISSIFFT